MVLFVVDKLQFSGWLYGVTVQAFIAGRIIFLGGFCVVMGLSIAGTVLSHLVWLMVAPLLIAGMMNALQIASLQLLILGALPEGTRAKGCRRSPPSIRPPC